MKVWSKELYVDDTPKVVFEGTLKECVSFIIDKTNEYYKKEKPVRKYKSEEEAYENCYDLGIDDLIHSVPHVSIPGVHFGADRNAGRRPYDERAYLRRGRSNRLY